MKSSEIVVGDDYAVLEHGTVSSRYPSLADRARVLAVERHEKTVHTGKRWDIRGHRATLMMVHVEWLQPDGRPRGYGAPTSWVVPAKVLRTWEREAHFRALHEAQSDREQEQFVAARSTACLLEASLLRRNIKHAVTAERDGFIHLRLSTVEAERLVARLEAPRADR